MSKGNVDKFLGLMQKDEGLARKMAACLYKLETSSGQTEGSGDFIAREIVPLAKEYGLEFTAQDFLDYTEEAKAKAGLTTEDLAEVSGGKGGVRAALMGTLALLGVAAAPAAMDMVSGGEVSPFSMVASAATPLTEEQKAELELVLAGLEYLNKEFDSSGLIDEDGGEALYEKILTLIEEVEGVISNEEDEEVDVDVAALISEVSNLVAELKSEGLKSEWWSAKDKIDEVVTELAQYLDEGLIFSKDATNIKENLVALKTSLTEKNLTSKKLKEIKQRAEDFQEKLYDAPSPKKIVKKLKSEKEELAKKIGKEITSLKEKNNTATNDAIWDLEWLKSRLETEVEDLTAENVLDKEKIVKEVKNEFGEISKKIDTVINLNFDIQQTKTEFLNQLDLIKKQREMQKITDRTEDKQKINDIKQRINKLGKGITYNTVEEKTTELTTLQREVNSLQNDTMDFEANWSTHVTKPKKNIGEMLTILKTAAKKAKDQAVVDEIEKLEKDLATVPEKGPRSQKDLEERATKLKNIKESIPQIKAILNKATTLKNIAEQVNADFAEVFDNIIKEIEAADSAEKVVSAANKLISKENEFRNLMRTKINEANKMAPILYETAENFGLNQLKGNLVDLIDTFENFNYAGAPIAELYKVYQEVETVNITENELKNYLGKQIDDLKEQANDLKDQANGVDDDLEKSFEETANRLQDEKENLLKDLFYATKTITSARESLAERQGDLMPKLALMNQIDQLIKQAKELQEQAEGVDDIKNLIAEMIATLQNYKENLGAQAHEYIEYMLDQQKQNMETFSSKLALKKQIATLKEQATTLQDVATGVDNTLAENFNKFIERLNGLKLTDDLQKITTGFNQVKDLVNERVQELAQKLALKNQIAALKEQATKLKNRATGVDDTLTAKFDECLNKLALINLGNNLEEITDDFNSIKDDVGIAARNLALKLSTLEEVRTLLTIDSMGAEIQEELQNLEEYIDEDLTYLYVGVDPDTGEKKDFYDYYVDIPDELLDVFDKLTAVKTKIANKLLEWHKLLSDYHHEGYHKEGVNADDINFNLEQLNMLANSMITGADGTQLNEETLKFATELAQGIAENFNINDAAQGIKAEIDELLQNEIIDNDVKAKLNKIKNTLGLRSNATKLFTAIANIHDIKIDMANKLLKRHEVLSEYHNKGYHKEGVNADDIKFNLEQLNTLANSMITGANGTQLNEETLKFATELAQGIAGNLRTDIADVINRVKNYNGFGALDITAGTQANTLATFLRKKINIVDDLKFVDNQTRAKLATDIKHIFDQIKIDQTTGKYYLPGFYNQLGAVNYKDLRLICDAYDVVADDFEERVSYTPFVEGTTETTNGWSFSSILSSFTGAKEQSQLINKTTHLINELKNVSRLDLLDVSPESREALKKDILEIGKKINSTPGWFGRTLSLEGVSQKETKNMQDGLAGILEFYNYLNG